MVILILLFTYRSPILWILPIFSAVVALFTAEALIYFLAKYAGLTVNGQSQGILTVLVIGAGTDYALLLVARYREELRRHEDRHEAMAFALHRATPAILASAATVAVGMLCLTLAEMNSTAGLGPVLAIGVAVTLLVMVTLLPALLVIFGRWVFWPKRPTFGSTEPTAAGLWARSAAGSRSGRARSGSAPRSCWPSPASGCSSWTPAGLNSSRAVHQGVRLRQGSEAADGARAVRTTSSPVRWSVNADKADEVADGDAGRRRARRGQRPRSRPSGRVQLIDCVPSRATWPTSRRSTRSRRSATRCTTVDGADALVGGTSAIYLDIQTASTRDNRVIIPIVLVVVMLILMLLLRAVLSPVLLIGTVILSFGAALGLSTLLFHGVFTHLFGQGGGFEHADASFPLFVFVFLVALGIDYNIFLMTRVREETQARGTRQGSLVALQRDRRRDHLGRTGAGGDVRGARPRCRWCSWPSSARRSRSASSSTR